MKHSDGYTEHVEVRCPVCNLLLVQCAGINGAPECELKQPRKLKLRKCDKHGRNR